MGVLIRPFEPDDWPALWPLLHATFAKGDTYTYAPDASEAEIRELWTRLPRACFVACSEDGQLVGSYFLKPNQPGHGNHVRNCGYVVADVARGQGIASQMCEHSQALARELGFLAMQFNFVVSTNAGAVRLWQKLGFDIVGVLPRAFRHPEAGLVDAYVMFKTLDG